MSCLERCPQFSIPLYTHTYVHSHPHTLTGGAVAFTVDREGHSNIESSEATREQIIVAMESPKVKVWGVSGDGVTYNVYVEELSGLLDIPTHGILGQWHSCSL